MAFDVGIFFDALTSSTFLRGAALSVLLALLAMFFASVIGFGVALMRISKN